MLTPERFRSLARASMPTLDWGGTHVAGARQGLGISRRVVIGHPISNASDAQLADYARDHPAGTRSAVARPKSRRLIKDASSRSRNATDQVP